MGLKSAELSKVDRTKLPLNERLPGSLCDAQGKKLVPKGTLLDQATLDQVIKANGGSRFIPVGPDWPKRAEPATVSDDLTSARGIVKKFTEDNRRAHPRHAWNVQLELEISENVGTIATRRKVKVTTQDLSVQGFGFLYNQFIHPGTTVHARFDSLPSKPMLTGTVRSCTMVSGVQHRVGVEFHINESK